MSAHLVDHLQAGTHNFNIFLSGLPRTLPCVSPGDTSLQLKPHVRSHEAEMGLARAYPKVQCNPVICRVVRKIHSPLTPIRVLSPPMQLIGPRCYLGNAEQFNTLTRLLLCRRARAYHSKNYISTPLPDHRDASCIKKYPHAW